MKRSGRKRSYKIGEAVFRGQKSQYNFEVFPLTAEINDTPAIFVISRRITDKFRKGHHATVCLGETTSVVAELKRHKRAKCVKQNAANVICILKEASEERRSSVVDDLKAARSFNCVRNADQPNIKARLNVNTTRSRPRNIVSVPTEVKPAAATRSNATKSQPVKLAAKRTEAKKSKSATPKKAQPVKTEKPQPTKSKKSKPTKTVLSKTTKAKATRKPAPAAKAKPVAKTKPVKNKKSSRVATAVASKRPAAKRPSAATKPKAASPKRKTAAAKRPKATAARPAQPSKTRSRVQSGVDSKRGQHRLSKPKKPINRRTKSRTVGKPRSRQKAAA